MDDVNQSTTVNTKQQITTDQLFDLADQSDIALEEQEKAMKEVDVIVDDIMNGDEELGERESIPDLPQTSPVAAVPQAVAEPVQPTIQAPIAQPAYVQPAVNPVEMPSMVPPINMSAQNLPPQGTYPVQPTSMPEPTIGQPTNI